MEAPLTMRRPCFVGGEDDGLASIASEMEAGFSGYNNHNNNYYYYNQVQNQNNNNHPFVCHKNGAVSSAAGGVVMMRRRNSLRNLSSSLSSPVSPTSSASTTTSTSAAAVYSPRSGRFFDSRFEEPHFLQACFLCKKPLGDNRDIFMYRGDTPFCSEECRQEQIERDEAKEKNWSLKALRSKKEASKTANSSSSSSSSPSKTQNYPFRTGTVAAA